MSEYLGRRASTWQLGEIDFDAIDTDLVRNDEYLFYLLASASFVEIMSELYACNLADHYRENSALVTWLEESWQREETQHGKAFKAYVTAVWPDFDWEGAYSSFAAEYAAICTTSELEPSQALEMVARCVVEMGTSTLYRALHHYTREPVLRRLLSNIKADEVRHFGEFRHFFREYNRAENNGVWEVARTMWTRITEIRGEDTYIAFKHVYLQRNPDLTFQHEIWTGFMKRVNFLAHLHYPYRMAVDMLLSPLPIPQPFKNLLRYPMILLARATLFR